MGGSRAPRRQVRSFLAGPRPASVDDAAVEQRDAAKHVHGTGELVIRWGAHNRWIDRALLARPFASIILLRVGRDLGFALVGRLFNLRALHYSSRIHPPALDRPPCSL